ncbi:MAG: carboxypeptidase-like regulatory domain-containing protein [Lutibacter sp.]|jgi:hypothetical protein|uniref:carboxypeptidase-like regulatory domain-containing protein n=1 Tax=Lutibacter sp. TaxID=1925666 RepID=UPI00299E4B4D|nr:carboxypeptidase-like regulatory domain-containing protein [Lutibacter sp.]MDX1829728.1 carboxypeptidase-like regulatory domain-containing protein [Lutibacter sp.]
MKLKLLVFFVFISASFYGQSFKEEDSFFSDIHKKGEVKGKVIASDANNDPLIFANITVKELNLTTTSDTNGNFSFKLEPGNYTLLFDFIGYKSKKLNVVITSNNTTVCNGTLNALTMNSDIVMSSVEKQH